MTARRLGPAAVALLAACPAVAQQEPEVVSPRPELKWLNFSDIQAALTTEWRRDVDDNESAGGADQHDVQDRIWEILDLSTKGSVGHPDLLSLDLAGRFWLTQRWLEQQFPASNEFVSESLWDWNINGLFLQQQALTTTVYSRQTTSDINRPFAGTLENTVTQTGLRLNLNSNKFPTTAEVYTRFEQQVDPFVGEEFNINQNSALANGRVEISAAQALWWDFSYNSVTESGQLQTPENFDQLTGEATHTWNFGPQQRNELRSQFSIYDQTGFGAYRQLRLFERLRFNHSDRLSSWYDVNLQSLDRTGFQGYTEEVSANVRHQLFDSLTTQGRAGGTFVQVPDDSFDSNLGFGELNLDYVKKAPYGRIDAGFVSAFSLLEQSERGVPVPVNDTLLTFTSFGSIFISQRNTEPSSIVVTDSTGTIVYTEGIDYTVLELPDGVEIQRIPGGAIAPGQSVLVDYVIGPEPAGTTLTSGIGGNFRYTFEDGFARGVSLYTRFFWQDESRSTEGSGPEQAENDFREFLYGIEYNIWRIYLQAEQRIHDSDLSPFDATRLEARFTQPMGRGGALVLDALYQKIDRTDLGLLTTSTSFSAQWNQQITEHLGANLSAQWQDIKADPGIDSQAFEQEFRFSWKYRQTEIYGRIRNSFVDSDVSNTSFQTYVVGFRREF